MSQLSALRPRRLALSNLVLGALLLLAHAAAAQDGPAVVLAAGANDHTHGPLAQGTPLVVTAVACGWTDVPVTLAPAGGWAGAFRLTVTDAGGRPAAWPLAYASGPTGAVALAGDCASAWAWTLGPDATAALAPGDYVVALSLEADGLPAPIRATPVRLHVEPAPAAPTPAQAAERLLLLADFEAANGRPEAALAHVEALVAAQPGHPAGRLRQARALAAQGRPVDALRAVEAALAALPDSVFGLAEPPAGLLEARNVYVAAVEAATGFVVTHRPKSASHPTAGQGASDTFVLDGVEGREPVLRRGTTYTFRMAGVPASSPFYLTTNPAGAGAAPVTAGVVGAPASGDGEMTFTPGPDAPAVLYYASAAEPFAGWRLHVEDAEPTTGEPAPVGSNDALLALSDPAPNPTRDRATLTVRAAEAQRVEVVLYDVLGRRVGVLLDADLAAGESRTVEADTRSLAPGVYVVRAVSGGVAVTRRLTVAR